MEVVAKAAASFSFYAILYRAVRRVDEVLWRDLPMQSPGVSDLHAVCRTRERTLRYPAKVQREEPSDILGPDRPVADGQNLYARRIPGVFYRTRQKEKSKWILSDRDCPAAHVGHQDETNEEGEVGDGV